MSRRADTALLANNTEALAAYPALLNTDDPGNDWVMYGIVIKTKKRKRVVRD